MLFRFFRVMFTSRFRPKAGLLEQTSMFFRVWPTDLDVLWHMNNGKYLSVMDLGRFDMLIRNGLMKVTRDNGWYPVIAGETIRFRRSLTLWKRFELRTRSIGWDEKSFFVEQQFYCDNELCAHAIVRARFLSKAGGSVTAEEMAAAIDPRVMSPKLPDYVIQWQQSEASYTEVLEGE